MSTRASSWRRPHLLVAAALAGVVIAFRWVPQLRSSLWLDETGTVWLLQGGLADSISNALQYQGGSPLFYVVEWATTALFGTSELALRLPSLVAMGLTAWFVFLLGRRLFDAGAGAVAALVYVSLPLVGFAAGDARPYALASMALTGSALALVRWLDSAKPAHAIAYVVAFAATVYLHYMFALPLVAQGIYVLARRGRTPAGDRQIVLVYAAAAAALVPAVPTLLRVVGQRGLLSNPFPLTPSQLIAELLPLSLVLVLVVGGVGAALVWRPRRGARVDLSDGSIVFLLAWFAVTFVGLVAISVAGSATVLVPRYFVSVLPALALLAGAFVTRLGAVWPQVALVAAVAVVSIVRFPASPHTAENWRAAAALERELVDDPDTPVLLFAGFVEARRLDWLEDSERSSYLNAPATAYPFEGDVIALPFGVNDESQPYMEDLVRDRLLGEEEFLVVTRGIDSASRWLDGRLGPEGVTSTQRASYGGEILVYLFAGG